VHDTDGVLLGALAMAGILRWRLNVGMTEEFLYYYKIATIVNEENWRTVQRFNTDRPSALSVIHQARDLPQF